MEEVGHMYIHNSSMYPNIWYYSLPFVTIMGYNGTYFITCNATYCVGVARFCVEHLTIQTLVMI